MDSSILKDDYEINLRGRKTTSFLLREFSLLLLRVHPVRKPRWLAAGMKVISVWERIRGFVPRVSLPFTGPKVF